MFPGFGLVALLPTPDHGMQSEGLAFFTGQELRVEPEIATDGKAAARIELTSLSAKKSDLPSVVMPLGWASAAALSGPST